MSVTDSLNNYFDVQKYETHPDQGEVHLMEDTENFGTNSLAYRNDSKSGSQLNQSFGTPFQPSTVNSSQPALLNGFQIQPSLYTTSQGFLSSMGMQPGFDQQQHNGGPNYTRDDFNFPVPQQLAYGYFGPLQRPSQYATYANARQAPTLSQAAMLNQVERMKKSDYWNSTDWIRLPNGLIEMVNISEFWNMNPAFQGRILTAFEDFLRKNPNPQAQDDEGVEDDQMDETAPKPKKRRIDGSEPRTRKSKSNRKSSSVKPKKNYRYNPYPAVPANVTLPVYSPDPSLTSATACLDYLSHPDPARIQAVDIENDDWQDVASNRIHEFVGQLFNAILHPYSKKVRKEAGLDKDKEVAYGVQQRRNTVKVRELVGVVMEIKQIKARCYLLVDAVLHFHRVGVHKVIHQGYKFFTKQGRQVERRYNIDLESICSERLAKVVAIVQQNKLVALDLLEGNNFDRIAQDPNYYLLEKFLLLKSNSTRQKRTNELTAKEKEAQDEKKMKSWKAKGAGKKTTEVDLETESEDSDVDLVDEDESGGEEDGYDPADADDEYQPKNPAKNGRSQ